MWMTPRFWVKTLGRLRVPPHRRNVTVGVVRCFVPPLCKMLLREKFDSISNVVLGWEALGGWDKFPHLDSYISLSSRNCLKCLRTSKANLDRTVCWINPVSTYWSKIQFALPAVISVQLEDSDTLTLWAEDMRRVTPAIRLSLKYVGSVFFSNSEAQHRILDQKPRLTE